MSNPRDTQYVESLGKTECRIVGQNGTSNPQVEWYVESSGLTVCQILEIHHA